MTSEHSYTQNCPTCGTRVRVVTGDEGTSSYQTEADDIRFDAYVALPEAQERFERAEAALAELVRLKDGPRDAEYDMLKPAAWDQARRVLGLAVSGDSNAF